MDRTELYRDIAERTNGDIYIGVVGPGPDGKIDLYQTFHGSPRIAGDGGSACEGTPDR